jgi:hypothetical protein
LGACGIEAKNIKKKVCKAQLKDDRRKIVKNKQANREMRQKNFSFELLMFEGKCRIKTRMKALKRQQ